MSCRMIMHDVAITLFVVRLKIEEQTINNILVFLNCTVCLHATIGNKKFAW